MEAYGQLLHLKQVDPIVQLFLATALLEVGSRGSWKFATAYGGHLQLIQDANASTNVNWINPTDENAAQCARKRSPLLDQLREMGMVNPAPQLAKMKQSLTINTEVRARWLVGPRQRAMDRAHRCDTPEDGKSVRTL